MTEAALGVVQSVKVSPDGTLLAYIGGLGEVPNLWVSPVLSPQDAVPVTSLDGRGVRSFEWASDSRHLLFPLDDDGDEAWNLHRVGTEGGEVTNLLPRPKRRVIPLALLFADPRTLLLAVNDRDPRNADVYSLDLETGELTLQFLNEIGAFDFHSADAASVHAFETTTADGGTRVFLRGKSGTHWEPHLEWGIEDDIATRVAGLSRDGERLYLVSSINSNRSQLVEYHIPTRQSLTVSSRDNQDVIGALLGPTTRELEAVCFEGTRRSWQFLDAEENSSLLELQAQTSGDIYAIQRDWGGTNWVATINHESRPPGFVVYDSKSRKVLARFAQAGSATKRSDRPSGEESPPIESIVFEARDGLSIEGYLTVPKLEHSEEQVPAILLVHGGPWDRDRWGYDSDVAFLSRLGYAVLRVNFRGSAGYGKDFLNAGNREWGGAMQNDLTDATKWLQQHPQVDATKIAIFGSSYGGYAALFGAATQPALYAGAIAIAAPTNLVNYVNSVPKSWAPFVSLLHARIGHPDLDAEFLLQRSPIQHVEGIACPIFIAHGTNDPRVSRDETLAYIQELQRCRIEVTYLEFENEGHGIQLLENSMALQDSLRSFLHHCFSEEEVDAAPVDISTARSCP